MTDGRRECISRSVPSALAHLNGTIDQQIVHDDSGDPEYRDWLRAMFPTFDIIGTDRRCGFAGAYANAWRYLADTSHTWVFSTEDDFVFERDVSLLGMTRVLHQEPHIAQTALRRQAWNESEKAAGGVVEQHPDDYEDSVIWVPCETEWGAPDCRPYPVLLHRRFWTTNPSLHRVETCLRGWPEAKNSEGIFTHQLIEDPDLRFAYWGWRDDEPWVTHIGEHRNGNGY
jgi:hypothetical protein